MSDTTLRVDDITIDPALQPRASLSEEVIVEYEEAMQRDITFPPVVVFAIDGAHVLVEGFHRVEARRRAGQQTIDAEVKQGSRDDAIAWAAASNRNHGVRRTNADKRRAVEMILALAAWRSKSDRMIADHCGVGHPLVADVRGQLEDSSSSTRPRKRVGKDGKARRPRSRRPAANEVSGESTCPHGGNHQPDEDGDCAKCLEPGVPKIAATTKDQADADPTEAHALAIIELLKRIMADVRKLKPHVDALEGSPGYTTLRREWKKVNYAPYESLNRAAWRRVKLQKAD